MEKKDLNVEIQEKVLQLQLLDEQLKQFEQHAQLIDQKISEIQNIYRFLFLKNNNVTQAIRTIEAEMPATKERDEIVSFITKSTRGIMRGYMKN